MKKSRQAPNPIAAVELVEAAAVERAPLTVDKEKGIIFGVKLGGRFSENCHNLKDVTEGTEYQANAYRNASPLYEGKKVYAKHNRKNADERGPFEYVGVIRNARYDDATDCQRGDFHYKKTHPNAPDLLEDVERGLGGFGFSHHIPPGGFEGHVANGRLVVTRIKKIKSVDLVDDPATTRNLWESQEQPVKTTVKAILEKWVAAKPASKAIVASLFEDDAAMSAPADMPAEGADPENELWDGFQSAIMAIINGDGTAEEKAKQVAKYLKAHEKLTKEPDKKDGDSDGNPDTVNSDTGTDTKPPEGAAESKEVRQLKVENLCLKAGLKPSATLTKALCLLESEQERQALIDETKAAGATVSVNKPKSGAPAPKPKAAGKVAVMEAKTREEFVGSIRD